MPTAQGGAQPRRKQDIEKVPGPHGFLEFQHPRLVEKPPTGAGWVHEIKFDGYRVQVQVRRGQATIYTRNGLDWTSKLERLASLAGQLEDCVLDGELCALRPDGYSDFSTLRSSIFKAPDTLVLMAFDILFRGVDDLRPYALQSRKAVLGEVLAGRDGDVARHLRFVGPAPGEGKALLTAACQLQWEGIVSKRLDASYRGGAQRSDTWLKSKCRPSESIIVGGYVTKNGRFQYLLGGVREPDGRLRYVGSIKGGYGGNIVPELRPRLKELAAEVSPFDIDRPRKTSDIHWLRPEMIAEVEMAEFTGSGKLRQASFKGLREDLAPS